jgi:hypothetical protein
MSERSDLEERLIGFIEVDTGTIVIGDPVYLLPDAERGRPGLGVSALLAEADQVVQVSDQRALLVQAFGGDGRFPVFGTYEDGELLRVTVDLVELQEQDDV